MTEDEYRRLAGVAPRAARNKYRARRTTYAGRMYDSKREAEHAAQLDLLERVGHIRTWLRQVPVDLGQNERLRVDFLVVGVDGQVWAEEIKGMETRDFRRKLRLWRKYAPFNMVVIYRDREETISGRDAQ